MLLERMARVLLLKLLLICSILMIECQDHVLGSFAGMNRWTMERCSTTFYWPILRLDDQVVLLSVGKECVDGCLRFFHLSSFFITLFLSQEHSPIFDLRRSSYSAWLYCYRCSVSVCSQGARPCCRQLGEDESTTGDMSSPVNLLGCNRHYARSSHLVCEESCSIYYHLCVWDFDGLPGVHCLWRSAVDINTKDQKKIQNTFLW